MKTLTTFWKLVKTYNVIIPIIQRDYAQGRNSEKIKDIRQTFVTSLLEVTSDKDKSISLDFIYGKVNSSNNELTLLDGQQRMTTLFLFHWFVLLTDTSIDGEQVSGALTHLQKFSYHTRTSAREFCRQLTNNENFILLRNSRQPNSAKLSVHIKDVSWFHSIWLLDPTISAMLVMLDEIESQMIKQKTAGFWSKLICDDSPPITFEFLNMNEFNLTDQLYVRMNARGKPLTYFENLKAWLLQRKALDLPPKFAENLDTTWADMFWSFNDSENGKQDVDKNFYRFFNLVTLTRYAIQLDVREVTDNKKLKSEPDTIISHFRTDDRFIPFSYYEALKSSDAIGLCNALNFLEKLRTSSEQLDLPFHASSSIKDKFFNRDLGLLEIAEFAALYLYVSKQENSDEINKDELTDWIRVSRNLIRNTVIDSQLDLVKTIQGINAIITNNEQGFNLHVELDNLDKDFKFQLAEEKLKTGLIAKNSAWKKVILEAERHAYFLYQIGFLLEMSKEDGEPVIESFKKYYKVAALLFDEKIAKHEEFLLQRALLTAGNYFILKGRNRSYCLYNTISARYRNENWRQVFNNQNNQNVLKLLLDKIIGSKEVESESEYFVIEALKAIIDACIKSDQFNKFPAWRKLLISDDGPEFFEKSYYTMIRFDSDDLDPPLKNVKLLSSTQMNGYWTDMASLYVHIKINENGYEIVSAKGSGDKVKLKKGDQLYVLKEGIDNSELFKIGDLQNTLTPYTE